MSLHCPCKSKPTLAAVELLWTHNRAKCHLFCAWLVLPCVWSQAPACSAWIVMLRGSTAISFPYSSTKLAVLLAVCSATASPAPALGVAAGQPCPARHLLAHGSSVLLQLVLPAQARTWLLLWPGKLGKCNGKSRRRMQMRLQLRHQNLGWWKPPPQQQ